MGTPFYHFEGYSRVESNSKAKKGKSIYSVAGEAERTPGYCDHIEKPKNPDLLYGVPFSEVVKMAEDYATKTFDSCGRAVRKTGLCAIFGVVSAPPDMSDKVWNIYKKVIIQYLMAVWGENLKSVIEHTDEYFEPDLEQGINPGTLHRHLHFGVVQSVGVNFAEIHPGIKAKRAADKAYGLTKRPEGMDDEAFETFKKEGRKEGDRAYRQAMRLVQDDFFINVGDRFGLLRYGPRQVRLSREEIIKRDHEKRLKQKQAVTLADQEEKAKEQAAEIEKAQKKLENLLSEKQNIEGKIWDREKAVSGRERDVSDHKKAVKKRETDVAAGERLKADFEKGLKTGLRGWQLPKPTIGEFAGHYIQRVAGEVMGKVQRAMNIIRDYNQKKAELEKEKAAFEAEKLKMQKEEASRTAAAEKIHSERVRGLRAAYDKLKGRILGVKTSQELATLQKELSTEQQHKSR
jgi:hypothetical protein